MGEGKPQGGGLGAGVDNRRYQLGHIAGGGMTDISIAGAFVSGGSTAVSTELPCAGTVSGPALESGAGLLKGLRIRQREGTSVGAGVGEVALDASVGIAHINEGVALAVENKERNLIVVLAGTVDHRIYTVRTQIDQQGVRGGSIVTAVVGATHAGEYQARDGVVNIQRTAVPTIAIAIVEHDGDGALGFLIAGDEIDVISPRRGVGSATECSAIEIDISYGEILFGKVDT